MIESMTILGFKAAQNVELTDLGPVNLFIGPNGSGKTSLLQAAFAFCVSADAGKLVSLVPMETGVPEADGIGRALPWLFNRRVDGMNLHRAIVKISRACNAGRIASEGAAFKRRLEPNSLDAWRLAEREKDLARADRNGL